MEIRYDKIKVETTAQGVRVIIPRQVGKNIALELESQRGPALVTDLLKALEPHFPAGDGQGKPISVIMTAKGFSWQTGVGADKDASVFITIRPPEIPGIHYLLEPQQAREMARALLDMADQADALKSVN